jgi:hypothetical protein
MLLEKMVIEDMILNGFNPDVEGQIIEYWEERLS